MNEEKKTFEAPVLTALQVEMINTISSSGWRTNSYAIPDLNDPTNGNE